MARVIKELNLDEISFVDRPAQEGATSRILKSEDAPRIASLAKAYLDPNDGAIPFNSAYQNTLSHSVKREACEVVYPALDALHQSMTSLVADNTLSAEQKQARAEENASEFIVTLRTLLPEVQDELMKAVEKASKSAGDHPSEEEKSMSDETAKVAELESKLADLQKSLEAAEVAKADAEAVSKMSDAEKSYMEGMSADERKAFMGMKPEERARRMKKSAEADETVEVEGETIAKSKVGAEVFAVMKAQAARIEAVEKQAAADREAAQMADLRKRADDEFNALPGSVDDRAGVLKALDAIENEDVRKSAYTILKAAQEHAKGGLVTKGVSDGTVSKSKADFDAKVTELAKSMPRHEALSKAREQFPAEHEAAYGAN